MTAPFLILGHRGARNKTHFQNSMSAFREARDAADGFETDAAISADGVIYLIHDITYINTVDYTLREMLTEEIAARVGDRRLDQMQSVEIDTLRLKNGEPIPKLTEVLVLFRDKPDAILNVELKSDNTVIPVIDLLRRTIAAGEIRLEQLIISSFNFPALAWARKNAPEFKICALFALETQNRERLYPWSANLESCYTPFRIRELITPIVNEINPDFFNLSLSTMSIANVAAIHAAFPQSKFIVWALWEPAESEAENILDLLGDLAERNLLYAWISDEPRMRKEAMAKKITRI